VGGVRVAGVHGGSGRGGRIRARILSDRRSQRQVHRRRGERRGARTVKALGLTSAMEFRRINGLPPYVFAHIEALKLAARRAGSDVVDLGFGNPDLPSPDAAVEKARRSRPQSEEPPVLVEQGHSQSSARRISSLYLRRFGVELDPETEVVTTIGAKEGLSHLMWVLLGPGDSALVPSPSYPIHIYAPLFAGAEVRQVRLEQAPDTEGPARVRGLLRQPHGVVGLSLAQAAGHRAVVPPQPDHGVCRLGLDATHRRLRA